MNWRMIKQHEKAACLKPCSTYGTINISTCALAQNSHHPSIKVPLNITSVVFYKQGIQRTGKISKEHITVTAQGTFIQ